MHRRMVFALWLVAAVDPAVEGFAQLTLIILKQYENCGQVVEYIRDPPFVTAQTIYNCISNFQAILFFFAARHLYPKIFERKGKEESRQNWRMVGGSSGAVPNSQPSHTVPRWFWCILGVEIFLGERVGGKDSPPLTTCNCGGS